MSPRAVKVHCCLSGQASADDRKERTRVNYVYSLSTDWNRKRRFVNGILKILRTILLVSQYSNTGYVCCSGSPLRTFVTLLFSIMMQYNRTSRRLFVSSIRNVVAMYVCLCEFHNLACSHHSRSTLSKVFQNRAVGFHDCKTEVFAQ